MYALHGGYVCLACVNAYVYTIDVPICLDVDACHAHMVYAYDVLYVPVIV